MTDALSVRQPVAYEALMDAAWPATERHEVGGWVLRAASGVTQRANSVWPRKAAGDPLDTLRQSAQWYRSRRLPLIFQVTDTAANAGLNALLDVQGFTRQSETLIMARPPGTASWGPAAAAVEIQDQPDGAWLDLWWSIDGRGGREELETARAILAGCPSLYALARDRDGVPAAVGRLALAGGSGGIYCMATSRSHRRQGYASAVLQALLHAGTAMKVDGFWLLVTAANSAGRELYLQAGFAEAGRYQYRQQRPQRAPTGC